MNVVGREQPALRVLPAHQRLDRDDRARRAGRRPAGSAPRNSSRVQRAAQRRPRSCSRADRPRAHARVEDLDARAPAPPWRGTSPRRRRAAAPRGRARVGAGVHQRDADADAPSTCVVAAGAERRGERRGQALGDRARHRLVGDVLAQHHELVAAEARRRCRPGAPRRAGGRRRWRRTSSPARWPRLSLTFLKWSRSRKSSAMRPPLRIHARDRLGEAVEHQRPVGQLGQRVVQPAVADLLLAGEAVQRVAEDVGHRLQERDVVGRERAGPRGVGGEHRVRAAVALDDDADAADRAEVADEARPGRSAARGARRRRSPARGGSA